MLRLRRLVAAVHFPEAAAINIAVKANAGSFSTSAKKP
jgi:hypothetical protein